MHPLGRWAQRELGRARRAGAAAKDGADYVSVGPIWETPSKPGRAGIGLDYLSQASTLPIPHVAIGGINETTLDQILPHSPYMIGVIRAYKNVLAQYAKKK